MKLGVPGKFTTCIRESKAHPTKINSINVPEQIQTKKQ
jgi:hypothetical protein